MLIRRMNGTLTHNNKTNNNMNNNLSTFLGKLKWILPILMFVLMIWDFANGRWIIGTAELLLGAILVTAYTIKEK